MPEPKHQVNPEYALQFWEWINTREGLAIWNCEDFGNLGQTWTTPVLGPNGQPTIKPHWSAGKVIRTITDPEEVEVVTWKEVKRFHVGVKAKRGGMRFVLTDAASDRVKKEVRKAAAEHGDASYEFDYMTQDALIMVPDTKISLAEYARTHPQPIEALDQELPPAAAED